MSNQSTVANLTHYSRNNPLFSVVVQSLVPLLPRETFADHPDVLDAYDTMTTLNAAVHDHRGKAAALHQEAQVADQKYGAAVTAAVVAGKGGDSVKNPAPAMRAEALAHEKLAEKTLTDATQHGYVLGELMAGAARECFGASEETLTASAGDVRASIAMLGATWKRWAEAWALRQTLSAIAYRGGAVFGFEPTDRIPAEVAAALATLERHLTALDTLKHDEAAVDAWRAQNTDWDRRAEDQRQAASA